MMKQRLILLLLTLISHPGLAIDDCDECHDEKWSVTPAHIWIDTEHHLDEVSCMDCHRWAEGDALPPLLPDEAYVRQHCTKCHDSPKALSEKMAIAQRH
ncbi:hypothetical protein [Ferrimonas sp. SCSIO 43195]|uniref:hypothetical protein n=1 Tax=Ferrimonas sp. SCSIO 43195 TaxID=2822844 RepID=UPI002074CA56|nr:hypothetical protein [Ferrimonas sp. SCSIO 43195]USD37361.1 hypothetical protein J8Z22_20665 [Ferrimonas sp. SCSIO 43195]